MLTARFGETIRWWPNLPGGGAARARIPPSSSKDLTDLKSKKHFPAGVIVAVAFFPTGPFKKTGR